MYILSPAGPFQHEVSQTLRLGNPHSDPVAFKVSGLYMFGGRCTSNVPRKLHGWLMDAL